MRIDCYFTYQSCNEVDFYGRTAVVIDVLRATSSIITAFMAGVETIIPIAEVADALALQQQLPQTLLAGEREGERLSGFDLGNSPYEFTREAVAGRVIIACTTNGTSAIQKAVNAEQVWLGALLNARAVAQKAVAKGIPSLAILCAGTDGSPSLDDIITAGAILHHLNSAVDFSDNDLNDSALMALRLYQSYANMNMSQVLALSRHGQKLIRFDRGHDVAYCAQQDICDIVPWLDNSCGRIYG